MSQTVLRTAADFLHSDGDKTKISSFGFAFNVKPLPRIYRLRGPVYDTYPGPDNYSSFLRTTKRVVLPNVSSVFYRRRRGRPPGSGAFTSVFSSNVNCSVSSDWAQLRLLKRRLFILHLVPYRKLVYASESTRYADFSSARM